jgi:hypothetical protein
MSVPGNSSTTPEIHKCLRYKYLILVYKILIYKLIYVCNNIIAQAGFRGDNNESLGSTVVQSFSSSQVTANC